MSEPREQRRGGHGVNFRVVPILLIALLAACGKQESGKPGASSSSGGGQTSASTPATKQPIPPDALVNTDMQIGVKGGRLIVGLAGDPKTFNPLLIDDDPSQRVGNYIYGALYGYDNFLQKEIPAMAKSWRYSESTRQWTFHLREGMKWSDGQPLTSDDFIFYTELARDTNIPTNDRDYYQSDGKPFTFLAPDPLTFIVQIPDVDSFAFMNLGLVKAVPRHAYEKAWKEGKFNQLLGANTPPQEVVCSGPFRLKEFRSGEKVVLEANPYYYEFDQNGTRLPYINELVMLNVPDYDAMALRFQAGDLDLMEDGIQPGNLVVLLDGQQKGNYTVHKPGVGLNTTHYWFNQKPGGTYEVASGKREKWEPQNDETEPPADIKAKNYRAHVDPIKRKWFSNRDFRIACSMASNRDSMIKTIMFNEGEAIYGFVPPGNRQWHNTNLPKFPYDLQKAAALLDKIGFVDRDKDGIREDPEGHPVRFTLITNKENNVREKIGVLLKEDLTKLGFGVTLQLLDFNDIITRTSDSYDYEVCLLGIATGVPPHPSMEANSIKSSGRLHEWNPMQKKPATEDEAKVDALYESMKKAFKVEEQKKIFDEIQAIVANNQCVIELVSPALNVAARNTIGNIRPVVLRPSLTYNIHQLYIKPGR